jgi:hypothetical protein
MKISVTKSCGIIFTQKQKIVINKPLTIKGVTLKMEKKVKFLGMIFDNKLTWTEHVEYTMTKCNKRLNLMRSLTGTDWGASKKSLLTIYKVLIRSLLDYGAIALDCTSEANKKKFDTIQYKALKISCGAMTGTSLAALQVECGEMPLEIRRKQQMIQYSVKIKTTENHPTKNILEDSWCNHYGKFGENRKPFALKVADFFDQNKIELDTVKLQGDPPWTNSKVIVDTTITKLEVKTNSQS